VRGVRGEGVRGGKIHEAVISSSVATKMSFGGGR
jgi:hypothetical protein